MCSRSPLKIWLTDKTRVNELEEKTMKLGLMLGYSGASLRIPIEDVQLAERLGYDSVWTAEAYGSDAITPLALSLIHI